MGQGPVPADIMIIGEAPGFKEDEIGRPFSGKAGQVLDQYLKGAGISREDVFVSNVVKCRPPDNRTPSKEEMKSCAPYLDAELKAVNPKFILLLGNTALQGVLGRSGIKKYRGQWKELGEAQVLGTYHPAAVLRNPSFGPMLKSDLTKLVQMSSGNIPKEKDISFIYVHTKDGLRDALGNAKNARLIAYDIETRGPIVLCLGLWMEMHDGTEKGYLIPLGHPQSVFQKKWVEIFKLFGPVVARQGKYKAKTIAQNGKYDDGYFLTYTDSIPNLTCDTMLLSHILDENSPHGLDYISQTYCNAPNYKSAVNRAKLDEEEIKKVAFYNIQDCYYTLHAYKVMLKQLKKDPRLYTIFKHIVMPAARALELAEHKGIWLDRPRLSTKMNETLDALLDVRNEMVQYLPQGRTLGECINCKHGKTGICIEFEEDGSPVEILEGFCCDRWKPRGKAGKAAFNFNSSQQMAYLLFDHLGLDPVEYTKTGNPSTAEGTLVYLEHPFINLLLVYRSHAKMLSTYLRPWLRMMDKDGFIHSSFKLHGTVTGRLSSSKPNIQNIPRESDVRSIIGAPPGWVFVEADYSQVELRIVAHVSGDPTMLRVYATGGDIHIETACTITGKRPEDITKDERKKAKAVGFGFVYGMGWKTFKQYAKEKYDVELTEQECKDFRKRYFAKYKGLTPWHDRQRRIVNQLGYVRSPLGRKRRLPDVFSTEEGVKAEAERQSINSPVQAVPPDLSLLAVAKIVQYPGMWDEIYWVSQVHDALIFIIRQDVVDKWCPIIKEAMENPPVKELFDLEFQVPIVVDIKVGPSWGRGEEWKGD